MQAKRFPIRLKLSPSPERLLRVGLAISFKSVCILIASFALTPWLHDAHAQALQQRAVANNVSASTQVRLDADIRQPENLSVTGTESGHASPTVSVLLAVPATPTNPSPGSLSSPGPTTASSSVTLSWSASSGATSYEVAVRDIASGALVVDSTISGTSFTASLSGGKQYKWNVDACNSAGCSNFTTVLFFQTPGTVSIPATPTNPSPGSLSSPGPTTASSSVTLSWSASSGATSYEVAVRDIASGALVVDSTISGTSFTASLSGGKQYKWNVDACNSAGCSNFTTVLFFQTPGTVSIPATPTNPSPGSLSSPGPTTASSSVTLSWSASSGATSYEVAVRDIASGALVVDSTISGTSFTASLSGGKQYRWNLDACNSAGCSNFTAVLFFQTPGTASIPATPTNPSPGSLSSPGPTMSGSSVTLSWSASSGATTYGVGVRDMSTNVLVVDTNSSSTSFTANLSAGKPYRWNVDACNSAGCSSFTTVLYFQTPGAVSVPGPFTLSNNAPICDTNPPPAPAVRLNWNQSSGAVSYDLYRNGSLYSSGLSGITFYNSANVLSGQTYTYFVRARNSAGFTDSNGVTVNIPTNICTAATAPPAINNINPVLVTVNQATVLTVNGSNFQQNFGASVQTPSGTYPIASAGLTFVDSSQLKVQVTMGGTLPYSATLVITNPDGQTASSSFQVTLQQQVPGPFTLSNQPAVCDSNTPVAPAIRLNWTASNSAASYDLYRDGSLYGAGIVGTTFYNNANVVAGQAYSYFIRARNTSGVADSNTITVPVSVNICSSTVSPPLIAKITPSSVVVNQPTVLDVTGNNFQSNFKISVQGNNIDSSGLKFLNSNEVTVSVQMGGTPPYQATLTLTNVADGQSASNTFTVITSTTSSPRPVASFTYSPDAPLADQVVQFNAAANTSAVTYDWDFEGDGTVESHVQNPTHSFSAAGPHTVTLRVSNAYGSDSATKTLTVGTTVSGTPAINSVTRKYTGFFIKGSGLDNPFDVKVDWKGTPGTVSFSINSGAPIVRPGTSTGASYSFNLDKDFLPNFSPSVVKITATNSAGIKTDAPPQYVYVFPWPNWLSVALGKNSSALGFTAGNGEVLANLHFDFPDPHLASSGCIDIPNWVPYIGGKFGLQETYAQVGGAVSSRGTGTLHVGGQTGFCAAGQSLSGSVLGSGNFLLNEKGLTLRSASFNLTLAGTLTKEIGIVDAIPQLAGLEQAPLIGGPVRWFNQRATLVGDVSPSLAFSANWFQNQSTGQLNFSDATGTLKLDLKGTLKIKLTNHLRASGYVSGAGEITVGVPADPFVKSLGVTFEAGVNLNIDYVFGSADLSKKATFRCTWTPGAGTSCGKDGSVTLKSLASGQFLKQAPISLSLIQPNYARFGPYSVFRSKQRLLKAASSLTPLSVTESSFLANVFPGALPCLTQVDNGGLLLWVSQDPSLPVMQSTGISWSYNDGTNWSTPGLISSDTRFESSPLAGVDGNGTVVATWLRIKDPAFSTPISTTADLPLFYNQFDIASSVFDRQTKSWGTIRQVTDDSVLDNSLQLSSDTTGRLLLSWLSNANGQFTSTASAPSSLNFSFWNGSSWGSPSTIASNLVGVSTHAAAIQGTNAFIVVPRDPNAAGIIDLYRWNGSSWSAPIAFAAGGVENRLPSVTYDANGEGHVVWIRGNDLVHATLSDPTPKVIRAGSSSMAFYDVRLLNNPQGVITLIWEEIVDNGPANIFATLYDPTTQTWSADRRLTEDSFLAHDVSGYYGNDGQLHLAYLATQINRTTDIVTINGESQTIVNIPEDGASDLRLLDHSLISDLAITEKDITINPELPHEGDAVSVVVDVHNAGDFAVGNFVVSLYGGEPSSGGVLIATRAITDTLRAGDHRAVPFSFNMPAGTSNIVVIIDPSNAVAEFTKTNNKINLNLNNTAPQAGLTASVTEGDVPLSVDFDASASFDKEGDAMVFMWTFADGSSSVGGMNVSHRFSQPGVYPVTLAVTDSHGAVGTTSVTITATPNSSALRIDSVAALVGRASGGQQITLTGAFPGLSSVSMGGMPAAFVFTNGANDTSKITITTPAHAVGAVQIDLTASGTSFSKANAFAYLPTVFTDDTIAVAMTTAKAQHIIELRQAVDALRAVAGLGGAPWTDPNLAPNSNIIRAVHIQELRTYFDDAATRLGYATQPYTDPALTNGFLLKRVHIEELRQRIRAIAG